MTVMTTTDKRETRADAGRDPMHPAGTQRIATIRAGIHRTGIGNRKRGVANVAETYVQEVNK